MAIGLRTTRISPRSRSKQATQPRVQIAGYGEAVGNLRIAQHVLEFLARHEASLGDPLIEGRRTDGGQSNSKENDTSSHQPAGAVQHSKLDHVRGLRLSF